MKNIWNTLPKPFFVQAPMENVTDSVFRQIIGMVGKPDVYFTEFTNADAIIRGSEGYVKRCLQFTKSEQPLIVQIWGNNPGNYKEAAKLLSEQGFAGIDINMGCPIKDVIKRGECSALINNPELAKSLYLAAVEGSNGLPVSIKTRIGFSKIQTEEWIGFLLELKPAAIIVHARTTKEMSKVYAHWEEFGKIVKLRDKISPETKIVGNGDIISRQMGEEIVKMYGVDGIMIGRGILHNPWVFNPQIKIENITIPERLDILKRHIKLFDETWNKKSINGTIHSAKNFEIMKKFYKAYLNNYDDASNMRVTLMQFHNAKDTLKEIDSLSQIHTG